MELKLDFISISFCYSVTVAITKRTICNVLKFVMQAITNSLLKHFERVGAKTEREDQGSGYTGSLGWANEACIMYNTSRYWLPQ